ncbi:enoyl-CoA hydratase/isomerase family protein [Pollutimonas bauzanensis]|uniref:enoyl-CoA hydratase/isomerase family protein n=1 Tax=Pollutimonas bauzanensis TaxID=658167 RepID=UPI003341FABA
MNDFVLRERYGATLVISINRPDRLNAFDLEVRHALGQAIIDARDDDTVQAIIITGTQGVFSAGGDLKALSEEKRPVFKDRERIRRLHPWFRELVNLEKPVIAAVDGPAFGGGLNLALACDFIIGTSRSRYCAVFARLGMVPDLGGLFLLPRIVGLQRAKDLVFSAREFDAYEALRLGILFRIVEPDCLLENALALAERYHQASTIGFGMSKNILNRSFNLDQDTLAELESYAQAVALHTPYHDAAVANFLNKRPLLFPGDIKP